MQDSDRLAFLVEFCQDDLAHISPPRAARLAQKLDAFVTRCPPRRGTVVGFYRSGAERALDGDALRSLQRELRAVVDLHLTGGRSTQAPRDPARESAGPPALPRPRGWYSRAWIMRRHVRVIVGHDVCDVIVLVADQLLASSRTTVRRCAECATLFVRRGRAVFCSLSCQRRVTQRRWRARHRPPTTTRRGTRP